MKIEKEILNQVNEDIVKYIQAHILPKYKDNDGGHGLKHIEDVLKRIFDLNKNLKLNLDSSVLFVITTYHDIARSISDDEHEILSAKIFMEDDYIKKFFTDDEINLISEAIEDHRASLDGEPRSVYGKLISSADRNYKVEQPLMRTHQYSLRHNPDYSLEQMIQRSFDVLKNKFNKNTGYANKIYFDDGKYEKYLNDLELLFSDYELFRREYLKVNEIAIKNKNLRLF